MASEIWEGTFPLTGAQTSVIGLGQARACGGFS